MQRYSQRLLSRGGETPVLPIHSDRQDRSLAATLALVLTLLLSAPAFAQENEPAAPTVSFEGPEVFAHVLHRLQLEPIKTLDALADDPPRTVLVYLGNPRLLSETTLWPYPLEEFQRRGGSLLVATDQFYFNQAWGVAIRGSTISQPDGGYGNAPRCPWLPYEDPVAPERGLARDHPLFRMLHQGIATNCPSHVTLLDARSPLTYLLDFPKDAERDVADWPKRGGMKFGRPRRGVYAYMVGSPAAAPPDGRVLFIAGHGIFMNGMMLQPDNDNFAFAVNAVRWLREGDGQPRTRALFIVDGTIIERFDMNLTVPPPPIPLPTVNVLNRLIRGWEDERFFHRMLGGLLGDNWNRLLALMFGATTLGLVIYGLKKLLQARTSPELNAPSVVGVPVIVDVATPAAKERRLAIVRQREFGELARTLVHEWFASEFGLPATTWQPSVDASFEVEGFLWSRWRLQRHAALALKLARAEHSVSRREFYALIDALRELTTALREGRATLHVAGKTVRQIEG